MIALARTETAEQRAAIFAALHRRNRLVRVLRIGLPAIGVVILLGLMLQIYVGSLMPDLGFANVTIDRENLVVEAPVYAGTGTDGTTYAVSAASARTAFGRFDVIGLTDAVFTMVQGRDATRFTARAAAARLQMTDQTVVVDGTAHVEGSDGMHGTLLDATLDVDAETLQSAGAVDLTFSTGANIKAANMHYDGTTRRWRFERAVVDLPATPGEAAAP